MAYISRHPYFHSFPFSPSTLPAICDHAHAGSTTPQLTLQARLPTGSASSAAQCFKQSYGEMPGALCKREHTAADFSAWSCCRLQVASSILPGCMQTSRGMLWPHQVGSCSLTPLPTKLPARVHARVLQGGTPRCRYLFSTPLPF